MLTYDFSSAYNSNNVRVTCVRKSRPYFGARDLDQR